jgi:hypothetical protein
VAGTAAGILAPSHLEDTHLVAAPMARDRAGHRILEQWRANSHIVSLPNHEHLVEINRLTGRGGETFDTDNVAHRYSVLLATGFDYGIHGDSSPLRHAGDTTLPALKGGNSNGSPKQGQTT